jgi:hypothetical protein
MTPLSKGLRFRMTVEQHEGLLAAAERNGRSLQKELEFRVFGDRAGLFPEPPADELTAVTSVDQPLAPPRVLPEHKADPRDKATQEHGRKPGAVRAKVCVHRVAAGSYCKRCEEEAS